MKGISIAACMAALCVSPSHAAQDVMAGFYGNTIVSTGGPAEIHTHYRADRTFDFTASMMFVHRTFKGTWAADGKGNVCRTYIGEVPPDTPNPSCFPIVPRKAGDVWTSKDGKRTLTLKAGIQ